MNDSLLTLVATIVGLLIGSLLTLLTGQYQRTHALRLKLKEKLLDRRIDAHEKILKLSSSMILVNPVMAEVEPGRIAPAMDDEGELMRYPRILQNREEFGKFGNDWTETMFNIADWLSNDLVRELYLFQDYSVNLSQFLQTVDDKNIPIIGCIIRQDFINFSTSIRRLAYRYFYSDLEKLRLEDNLAWHKYKPEETMRRLNETLFFKKSSQLSKFIKS